MIATEGKLYVRESCGKESIKRSFYIEHKRHDSFMIHLIITDEDEGESNNKCYGIGIEWIIIFPEALAKNPNVWVQIVFAQCLENLWSRHEAGQGGGQGGRKTT